MDAINVPIFQLAEKVCQFVSICCQKWQLEKKEK
jgi:hypothetical protein